MDERVIYVISGHYVPDDPMHRDGPRRDYDVFVERNNAKLMSLNDVRSSRSGTSALLSRLGKERASLAAAVRHAARDYDAIVTSGEDIGLPIALMGAVARSAKPLHVVYHGHHSDRVKMRAVRPLLRRLPELHLHCLSESLARETAVKLGIDRARCHATGYGADVEFFSPAPRGPVPVIASAGAAYRDYETLLAAVAGLEAEVRIAAASPWTVTNGLKLPGALPPRVEIRSYETYTNLRDLYRRSAFVVVPMHPVNHACGYAVIAEAMATGRAVIASRLATPPDFIVPGETGLFVAPGDVDALRTAMLTLLGSPERCAEMGDKARRLMVSRYSLEHISGKLERQIEASIGPGRRRGRGHDEH